MMNNRAKILVDTAEYPEEIDMRRAKEAEERAKAEHPGILPFPGIVSKGNVKTVLW